MKGRKRKKGEGEWGGRHQNKKKRKKGKKGTKYEKRN